MRLAFIGGTGPEGLGLALRFAHAGDEVIIGSRKEERAQEAAQKIRERVGTAKVTGMLNADAARQADLVLLTFPFEGQKETLLSLQEAVGNKIVVDTVVPVLFQKGKITALPVEEGSATEQAQRLLPTAQVVGAFHNLSAKELAEMEHPLDADVLVVGDHREAKATVLELARKVPGVRAVDAGGLTNARYVEDITVLLLNINRIHKATTSIRVTGLPSLAEAARHGT